MRRVLRTLVRILGLLILVALLAFGWLVWQVDQLGREDHARSADAIVVLGARVEKDGQPGPDLRSRTQHAVALWKAGFAPQIICTGGYKNERLSAASVCRRFAAELDVPAERVWLADGSQSTYEDAEVAASVMAAHGWRSAILVSHPLHLYRASWLFRAAGVEAVTSPTSTDIDRIDLPDRVWLALREAGALVVTSLDTHGLLPARWTAQIQTWKLETGY